MNGIPAILDVDPGHDDAVALMMACGAREASELDLLAVTTVAGNVELEKTTHNTLRVLSLVSLTHGHTRGGRGRGAARAQPPHCL